MASPDITIYHAPGTRSIRVIWLCEELNLAYRVKTIDFSREYRDSSEWRVRSPTGKVPAMDDGSLTLFESGAMVQYLLDKYGEGRLVPPSGTKNFALYCQWSWFAEATLARPLGDIAQHTVVKPQQERLAAVVKDGEKKARTCLAAMEPRLAKQDYLIDSEFTAADIMMGYSIFLADRFNILDDNYPSVQIYFDRLMEREGFQKALKA